MGKIYHAHDTKNEYQANREQCKKTALDETVYNGLEKKLYRIILL